MSKQLLEPCLGLEMYAGVIEVGRTRSRKLSIPNPTGGTSSTWGAGHAGRADYAWMAVMMPTKPVEVTF